MPSKGFSPRFACALDLDNIQPSQEGFFSFLEAILEEESFSSEKASTDVESTNPLPVLHQKVLFTPLGHWDQWIQAPLPYTKSIQNEE